MNGSRNRIFSLEGWHTDLCVIKALTKWYWISDLHRYVTRTNNFELFGYANSPNPVLKFYLLCSCGWIRISISVINSHFSYQLSTHEQRRYLNWSFWVDLHNRLPTYKDGTLTNWVTEGLKNQRSIVPYLKRTTIL